MKTLTLHIGGQFSGQILRLSLGVFKSCEADKQNCSTETKIEKFRLCLTTFYFSQCCTSSLVLLPRREYNSAETQQCK